MRKGMLNTISTPTTVNIPIEDIRVANSTFLTGDNIKRVISLTARKAVKYIDR